MDSVPLITIGNRTDVTLQTLNARVRAAAFRAFLNASEITRTRLLELEFGRKLTHPGIESGDDIAMHSDDGDPQELLKVRIDCRHTDTADRASTQYILIGHAHSPYYLHVCSCFQ